ncbi:MAG: hypothetical protein AAF479_14255, partial [Pseudomonadota bacterium]
MRADVSDIARKGPTWEEQPFETGICGNTRCAGQLLPLETFPVSLAVAEMSELARNTLSYDITFCGDAGEFVLFC